MKKDNQDRPVESKESPENRGNRLRLLRQSLKLSRRRFSEKHGIPMGTIQNWEDGRYNGMSKSTAERILHAFATENILFDIEWLLSGAGDPPQIPNAPWHSKEQPKSDNKLANLAENEKIKQELIRFRRAYPDSSDIIVGDNSMLPIFKQGDLIAGPRYYDADIHQLIGHHCIVQLESGETLVRLLAQGSEQNRYHLISNDPSNATSYRNVGIFSAAPVIWHRCRDPLANQDANYINH